MVGEDIFTCESGIHIDGLIKNPSNYEPYDPSEVCLERKLIIGMKAGTNALRYKLKSLGIKTEDHLLAKSLMIIKKESSLLKRNLTDEELLSLHAGL